MMFNPRIKISKLVIVGYGKTVYEQAFHDGINIIRGDNGTGKSTIMEFMFYVLGGEVKGWTREAGGCDTVYCETHLNDHIYTFIRDVEHKDKTKIAIYDGPYESCNQNKHTWQVFPYSRSEHKKSFSQAIFDILGLPYHKTEDQSNLTMHQVLRLIYLDQITPPNMMFMQEDRFDSESTRAAIGEYLLGLDNLDGHKLRQDLLLKNKEFDQVYGELNALYKFLGAQNVLLNVKSITEEIARVNESIELMRGEIVKLYKMKEADVLKESSLKGASIRATIEEDAKNLMSLQEERQESVSELMDIEAFVKAISLRLKCLEESEVAHKTLGGVSFKYCPSCMAEIDDAHDDACSLCKTANDKPDKNLGYLKIRRDLDFQLVESNKVAETIRKRLGVIKDKLIQLSSALNTNKAKYRMLTEGASLYDAQASTMLIEIGAAEKTIESLNEKTSIAQDLDALSETKQKLQADINRLKDKLEKLTAASVTRRNHVLKELTDTMMALIKLDDFEPEFTNPEEFDYDFGKNRTEINGRSKFSASSMVYLKNTFRLTILLSSLTDRYIRFPRFLLMDNIEDKGMQPERSHSFQHMIVDYCSEAKHPYQVIFTTSMISEDLEGSEYCVGPFYKKGTHTLSI